MLVKDLVKGQLLKPKSGKFYLYHDTWVDVPSKGSIVIYNIATIHPLRAARMSDVIETADCAVYVGRTRDATKIVGTFISYSLLIEGELYKFSGRELKYLECISNIGEEDNAKDDFENSDS